MEICCLFSERKVVAGGRVRIWSTRDGRFLLEHLLPTGQGLTIGCASLAEAEMLRGQIEKHGSLCPKIPRTGREASSKYSAHFSTPQGG